MYEYRPTNRFPYEYTDPDTSDLEHLVQSAYHMLMAGLENYSDQIVLLAMNIVERLPADKNGRRKTGKVTYDPVGILTMQDSGGNLRLRAPAMEIPENDKDEPAEILRLQSRAVQDVCNNRTSYWFISRQMTARLRNTKVKANLPVAKHIRALVAACNIYKPDAEPAIRAAAAQAVSKIVNHEPICSHSCTASDRMGQTASRYVSMRIPPLDFHDVIDTCRDDVMSMTWFEEPVLEEAVKCIKEKRPGSVPDYRAFDLLKPQGILWRNATMPYPDNCPRVDKLVQHLQTLVPEDSANRSDWACLRDMEQHVMRGMTRTATLLRAHEALCKGGSPFLADQLAQARVIDPELAIDPDLPYQVALALTDSPVEEYASRTTLGEDVLNQAREAIRECILDLRKENVMPCKLPEEKENEHEDK